MPLEDIFRGAHPGPDGPYVEGEAVTPSDGPPPATPYRGLWVGGLGNVAVIFRNSKTDAVVTFTAVPAGTLLPIWVKQVRFTGTTATNIIGLT